MRANVTSMRKRLCREMRAMFDDRTVVKLDGVSDNDLEPWTMDGDETRFCVAVRAAQIYISDNQDVPYMFLAKLLVGALCSGIYGARAAVFAFLDNVFGDDIAIIIRMAMFALFAIKSAEEAVDLLMGNDKLLQYLKARSDPEKQYGVYVFDVLPLYYAGGSECAEIIGELTWEDLRDALLEHVSQQDCVLAEIVEELPKEFE